MAENAALAAPPVPAPAKPSIHLRDVLALLYEKDPLTGALRPCSFKHYTFNRRSKEGGKLCSVPEAVALTEQAQANPKAYRERRESRRALLVDPHARHRPGDHWRNATRDFKLPTGEVHRVIIWLIVEFNGMTVRW